MPSRILSWPAVTMVSPAATPLTISTRPSRRWPTSTFVRDRLAVDDAEHVLVLALRHQRLLGQDQRVALVLGDEAHAREHAGPQRRVGVAHLRADHDRATGGVDQRVDREHLAFVAASRQRVEGHLQRLADLHLLQ